MLPFGPCLHLTCDFLKLEIYSDLRLGGSVCSYELNDQLVHRVSATVKW